MSEQPPIRCEFEAKDLILRLDRTLVCDQKAIDALVVDIMEAVSEFGCAEEKEFQARLVLEEALINAIEHGGGSDPSKEIQCSVCCDEDRGMLIVVRTCESGRSCTTASMRTPPNGCRAARRGKGRGPLRAP